MKHVWVAVISLVSLAAHASDDKKHGKDVSEVKVDVDSGQISDALKGLGLSGGDADDGKLWFFDTLDLGLFHHDTILRLRQGAKDDFTVKIRPIDVAQVDPSWIDSKGFKCDTDVTRDSTEPQCSLKVKEDDDEVGRVIGGKESLDDLATRDQKRFAGEYGMRGIDWSSLTALGPIASREWEYSDKSAADTVDAELWTLPDGERFLELSVTTAPGEEAQARKGLLALLVRLGVRENATAQNKTEFAMEYFARNKQH